MKTPRQVLAIDPSLTGTGWCRVFDGKVRDYDVIETGPEDLRPVRLDEIRRKVLELVDTAYLPLLVVMEAEIFLGNALTNADQSALQAILQDSFYYETPPETQFLSVNVAHVKKYIGAQQKNEILLRVFQRYKTEFTNDNIADAFVLAQIGDDFVHYRDSKKAWPELRKPQIEVLDKLLKQPVGWEMLRRRPKKKKEKRGE